MKERTLGWIQDPGKIKNLRLVVEIFDSQSKTHTWLKTKRIPKLVSVKNGKKRLIDALNVTPLSVGYDDLVGTGFVPRSSAKCNAIIQAAIKGQKRPFIADWPADNFLRWAVCLGFVAWNRETDRSEITELGLQLSRSAVGSDEEYQIYTTAFLSYPPVSRVITLLAEAGAAGYALTKFELGNKLGFIGEKGFTSISQNFFVKTLSVASSESERREIMSNWEGDSDKYARMICSWLAQLKLPWVGRATKEVTVEFSGENFTRKLNAYTLTQHGYEVRKMISGKGKFKKIPKIVHFEMLSTKETDRKYLRTRRAHIIKLLRRPVTLGQIRDGLARKGMADDLSVIQDDLNGLINIGLSVTNNREKFSCSDKIIGLDIPTFATAETQKSDALKLMEECGKMMKIISHEYLSLIPMSFDSKQSRMFEIKTVELLTEHCFFDGLHLGGANRPDGLVFSDDYGVIIDTKSYRGGFNIPVSERDKMKRYIEENQNRNARHNPTEWWKNFPKKMKIFVFLFVSGKFGGDFKKRLAVLSEQTGTPGSALSSCVLLNLAEQIAGKKINHNDFKSKISCVDEVAIK